MKVSRKIRLPKLPLKADVDSANTYVGRLVRSIGPGWHPEDAQDSYVDVDTGAPLLAEQQARTLSEDLARANAILDAAGVDICAVALPVQRRILQRMGGC